jgi:hypothetical protein
MKITQKQLRRLINEAMIPLLPLAEGGDSPGGPFEFTKPDDVQDGGTHPHILSIRMVEALRPVIQSGNVADSLEALDALWDHLRNTSPVPTSDVPENTPGDDIEWMEDRFHQDQEDWPDEG